MASCPIGNEMSFLQRKAWVMESLEPVMDCPSTILGPTTLRSISLRLDQDNGICASWEKLAELMSFTNEEIYKLKKCPNHAAEAIRCAALKYMHTIRELVHIIHHRLERRDIFTDEQIVKEILSDARRHYKSGIQRSFTMPSFWAPTIPPVPAPLSVPRFQGLNTSSFLPSYRHSEFSGLNSGLYSDSILYSPGAHMAGRTTPPLRSVGQKGPPYGSETRGGYMHNNSIGTTPKKGTKTSLPPYTEATVPPIPYDIYGDAGHTMPRNTRVWVPGYSFDNQGMLEFAPRGWWR